MWILGLNELSVLWWDYGTLDYWTTDLANEGLLILLLADTKLHFVQGKLNERIHRLSALLAISTPCFTHYFKAIIQGSTVVFKESCQLDESHFSSDWFFGKHQRVSTLSCTTVVNHINLLQAKMMSSIFHVPCKKKKSLLDICWL